VVMTQAQVRLYMYAARHMILKILIGMSHMRCGPMPEIQHSHRFSEFFLEFAQSLFFEVFGYASPFW